MSKRNHNLRPLSGNEPQSEADQPGTKLFAAKNRGLIFSVVNHIQKQHRRGYYFMVLAGLPGWILAVVALGIHMGWL